MFDVGGGELLLIVIAILLLFGPEKLPELAKSFGKGMSQLRKVQTEFQRNLNAMADEVDEVVQKQPDNQDLPRFERNLNATSQSHSENSTFYDSSSASTPFETHQEASTEAASKEKFIPDTAPSMTVPTMTIRPAENIVSTQSTEPTNHKNLSDSK